MTRHDDLSAEAEVGPVFGHMVSLEQQKSYP